MRSSDGALAGTADTSILRMGVRAADHAECPSLASAAGSLLLAVRGAARSRGPAEVAPGTEADRLSHAFTVRASAQRHRDDAVLSEEGAKDARRFRSRPVWIVDPLDGTQEYAEPVRTDWAVHVALVVDGRLPTGAVALPARGFTLSTWATPASPAASTRRPRIVVSRTRAPEIAVTVAQTLGAELVPLGSAGAKAMAVVCGEADVYLHAGGQYQCDSAAPVAVAAACGLHVSRLDGSPLRYNQRDPWLPDLLVCRQELARRVLEAVAATAAEPGRTP